MSNQQEEEIACAVAGDRDALTALLERYGPTLQARLRGEIAAKWQSMLEVDDVLQVTFVEVFLRIDRFEYRGPRSFEAWVTRIAKNNLTDAIRSLQQAKQLPPEKRITFQNEADSSVALLNVLGVTSGTPSRKAVAQELHVTVREAVAQLPRDYAQVLTLYDLEAKSAEEVATVMQRTPGAVYMLRARALDCLRDALGSESQFGP